MRRWVSSMCGMSGRATWPWVLAFVGVDFCYYWFHRASHRIRWFWCAHVVHHGSEKMNFGTALRQSLTVA